MKINRLGVFPNTGKSHVMQVLGSFLKLVRKNGMEPLLPDNLAAEYDCMAFDVDDADSMKNLDAAVSLGGDGTLLQMARQILKYAIPCFGVNMGHLGFLAEIDLQNVNKAIGRVAESNFTIESRSLLQAEVIEDEKVINVCHALNDIVLEKGMFSKMCHLSMYINGKASGRYAADGLIISTATGSTAYSLSAGGPLVMPELDVSIITPVCAHSLAARALVIPSTEVIELKAVPGSEEIKLSADGETITEVDNDTIVRITKSPFDMKIIRLTTRDYYQTWQQKLMRNL
ncbi:MAG: NAD(+)/NADH kinase [Phascolarctobacterium sp.]|nr:NAD(+)/NADH kinase [Phascolarctobacterium sp.]